MKTVYLLWVGDNYVDIDGSTEPDKLRGVFASLEAVNNYLKDQYFQMPFDTSDLEFDESTRAHAVRGNEGNTLTCYYQTSPIIE